VEFSIDLPIGENVIEYAKTAEKSNFGYAWIADSFDGDLFVTAARIARETNRIKLGLGNANPYSRHPATIALAAATLGEISNGRIVLALGAGGPRQLTPIGIETWEKPLLAVREAVAVVRLLLSGGQSSYEGKIFRLRNAQLPFRISHKVPIYVSAIGPRMLELAGEVGDGVFIAGPPLKHIRNALDRIRKGANKSGNSPLIGIQVVYSPHMDGEHAKAAAKPVVGRMIIPDGRFRSILKEIGISDVEISNVRASLHGGPKAVADAVTDEMVQAFAIAGTPDSCVSQIKEYVAAGVDHISLMPVGSFEDAVAITKEHVLPKVM
jgi:5,10-methylenetetrahydromethanopterin reductase